MDLAHFGKISMAFFLALIIFLPLVSAEQTVKTLEIPIGSVSSISANTKYIVPIKINAPDGIKEILSVDFNIRGDYLQKTQIYGVIEKDGDYYYCNPESLETPNAEVYNYELNFDCSDLARLSNFKGGIINFGILSTKSIENLYAGLRFTYLNNPKPQLDFSGTEYQLDETKGRIFVQLLSNDKTSTIDNATCLSNIYKPDSTVFLSNVPMNTLGSDGFYYYDLPTLSYEGVYMASVLCYVPSLVENISTSVIAIDGFDGQICSGSGWGSRWQFAGDEIYHTLSNDSELIIPREPDNFISIGGSFGSVYQDSCSILMKDFPNTTTNLMRIDLYASINNPNTKNFVYNVSMCPTIIGGLTSSPVFGTDCLSTPKILSTQNLSCSQGNVLQDFRDPIPFELNDDYTSGAYSEIITLNYVSGDVSQSSFWTAESKAPPSPPSTNRYRRVLNTTSSFVFPSLMNIKFYLSQASFVDSATLSGLTIPHSCHSGDWCLYLNGTRNGYAERTFDSSGATSLNITGWTDFHDVGIYDVARISFLDGASWETIKTWTWFDVHDWEYFEIILNNYDYEFGVDTILRFELDGTKGHFTIDDLRIEKTGIVGYYEDNETEYQLGRGSTEIHVSNKTFSPNITVETIIPDSFSVTDICYADCTTQQKQKSYPDCSCYCENKCSSGEIQDKYCTCHPAQLIGETIMEEVGFHDTLSYEAKLINSNTTASISGAKCDLVITDLEGSILIYQEDIFISQDNGYIKGNFRISDTFQVDNDYTFKMICGSSLASQNFTVKPTIQPNVLLNLSFFIRDNFIPIISVIVILLIFILFLIFGRKHR